ncbi:MAG: ABC transporter permease [Hungatella sp.]|nr:ABC transporter permease [Hungatella sp.]
MRRMSLIYLRLELKRAWRRLPHLLAGAIMLLFLAGMVALLASRMLYGDQAVGRVAVGVSVPRDDRLAKQVIKMISSLDSVESICDFQYMERETCLEKLEDGSLYAVLDVPEGFVESIMNGTNMPVKVWLAENTGPEGKLFEELADAGALTLSASQAGIYAGNELYQGLGLSEAIGQLEWDLNRRYLDYSLERTGYFRHQKVSATGDVSTAEFYMVSMYVLFLFLSAIPVSGYLKPVAKVTGQKLKMAGVGPGSRTGARILGMTFLMAAVTLPVTAAAAAAGLTEWSLFLAVSWCLSCLTASAAVVVVYQMAGGLLGGIMVLFLVITGQHFLAGGFWPLVFLPESIQRAALWLPSGILMNTMKMAVTQEWDFKSVTACLVLLAGSWMLGTVAEVRRQ